ncbi:NAD+ synthase [Moraxella catarrhalis]|jgi:NAD+ synthetase|uniref:Glutamine-dependent NAD(+) synthetase n=1 Tax=Moraxella catarrhalis TaxID=480 RepID=A0A3A9QYB6_MORCA|nr:MULTISPECIES: NAD+ synthase [Moraxella]ARB67229.1 NAD+ synthase [Moraxella catarrhalis]AZQ89639.1 NAD+ synthetase [Moraxella catarrhalis]AZQ92221.1 NAD+ synthetase [Moraxella catarrhalis]AZQ95062.1 NAD+ synthetase [Moraxella catarrhalis]EGE14470.1 NAD+ synthetase [Moraxella catarrhalis 46P47B1]
MPKAKTDATDSTQTSFHTADTTTGQMTFAIIQTNFWVGDIAGNVKKMHALTLDAKARGADIVIFPELALVGYPPEDLLLRPTLGERVREAMAKLAEIEGIVVILGYPHIDHHGTFNSAAILQDGSQKGFYHKQCLPNYGIFDEQRYFQKGLNQVLFDYKGVTIGLLICEDIWHDEPIQALKQAGADLVIVINASPFEIGKQTARKSLLTRHSSTHHLPIIYVNTVGAQDDIVFDGGSLITQSDGRVAHEGVRFLNQLLMARFDTQNKTFDTQAKAPLVLSEESEMYQALVVGLRDYVNRSGFKGVIVGLSGGIDSALTLCIAVDALGCDRVYAVMMPYEYTAQISLEDAEAQAARLNVSYTVCPIHDAVAGLRSALAPLLANSEPDVTEENLQARARGTILMALSNKFGHMVISTGNKSENAVGYSTLYGDMVGGFDVLKDVYKTDVYRLANYRNRLEDNPVIPERVITRPPSAELRPNQKDQDSLGDYETLDSILKMYIDDDLGYKAIVAAGFEPKTVEKILGMVDRAEYKRRQGAIGTKITKKSFGRERRYPLVNGWSIKG